MWYVKFIEITIDRISKIIIYFTLRYIWPLFKLVKMGMVLSRLSYEV